MPIDEEVRLVRFGTVADVRLRLVERNLSEEIRTGAVLLGEGDGSSLVM